MNGFSFLVGLRYTLSRKQSHLVAFISRVSTIGMVLAVSVLILVMSVMNGFDKELRERILAIVPHATLTGFSPTTDWRHYLDIAKHHPGVVDATPFSYLQGMVMRHGAVKPVFVYGIDPDFEKQHSILRTLMGDNLMNTLASGKSLVMGIKLAQKLKISKGDGVKLIVPSANTDMPVIEEFKVTGFLSSGTELDEKILVTHRHNVALLKGLPLDAVDGIRISVNDLFAASMIANSLTEKIGFYRVRDWTRTQGNLYQAVQMSRNMVMLLVFIIIAVAAFNVVSTLVLAVNDKAGDIAILRTMGASRQQILGIFIVQGSIIGFLGVSIGATIGVVLSLFVSNGIHYLEQLIHYQFLRTDVYPIDHLPSDVRWADVLIVAAVAQVLSIFATIIPALQASRVEPAKVLRYE